MEAACFIIALTFQSSPGLVVFFFVCTPFIDNKSRDPDRLLRWIPHL
jgi:hypothetical protein